MPYTVIIGEAGQPPLFGPILLSNAGEARAVLLDELTRHLEKLESALNLDQQATKITREAIEKLVKADLTNSYRVSLPDAGAKTPLAFQIFRADDEVSISAAENLKNEPDSPFSRPLPDDVD
jgi:hypothetical protein